MIKKYGASCDHTYKFRSLVTEENEKRKENNDSDKLIEENNKISK
jgi:hypothetical protein